MPGRHRQDAEPPRDLANAGEAPELPSRPSPSWPWAWPKYRRLMTQVCGQAFTGQNKAYGLGTGDTAVSVAKSPPREQQPGQSSCQRSSRM